MTDSTQRSYHKKLGSPSPGFDAYMERASRRQAEWSRWFAIFPVTTINGQRVWLRMVETRVPSHFDEQLGGWRPDRYNAKGTAPLSEYRLPRSG